jgi:hypothetical protein
MVDLSWVGPVGGGAICFGAGIIAWLKTPRSLPTGVFLAAMTFIVLTTISGSLYFALGQDHTDIGAMITKTFMIFSLLAVALLWLLTLIFPIERKVSFRPLNLLGFVMVATVVLMITLGATAGLEHSNPASPQVDERSAQLMFGATAILAVLTTANLLYSVTKADAKGKKSAKYFLIGFWVGYAAPVIWMLEVGGVKPMAHLDANIVYMLIAIGFAASGLLYGVAIATDQMSIKAPVSEKLGSSSKAKYKLLHRHVYLVEEPKPDFSLEIFSDVLKGRCIDCENDESFECESIDCSACGLPCPCRVCTKYKSRSQGLVVTRQFAQDIRNKWFLQTTPVLWLTTVQGPENMDPAKLAILTDYITNFMESSQNGVVLVDGIEYLVTSNDFQRVQKAIDRWTEAAMTSKCRLIISVDPKAFDLKELATMERDRETVRPDAKESWQVFPERI